MSTEDNSRGFNAIKGKTIANVNTQAINVVKITFTDGSVFEIDGENRHMGIPIIECIQRKEAKT